MTQTSAKQYGSFGRDDVSVAGEKIVFANDSSPEDDVTPIVARPAKVCVGIATRGRPSILAAVLDALRAQSVPPSRIIVSCVTAEDAGSASDDPHVQVICGPPGLARQRNAILAALPTDTEIVVFFDDDFIPHRDWLKHAVGRFRTEPDIVGLTGHVLADGIKGPGLSAEEAARTLDLPSNALPEWTYEKFSPYGCNMAFRVSAIGELRFDEQLVLYGWLEDRDFGAALAAKGGRLVKIGKAAGVHLGAKSGRVSGVRLGYSQMVNPVFMLRKGTISVANLLDHLFRNFMSNVAGSYAPEPFIDRRGRLKGNLIGMWDLVRGRITPERAERL